MICVFQVVFELPFNSVRRFQLVIAQCLTKPLTPLPDLDEGVSTDEQLVPFIVMLKGAPEIVLQQCSTIKINGEQVKLDTETINDCQVSY